MRWEYAITLCQVNGTLVVNMPLSSGMVRLVAQNGGVTQTAAATITAAALGVIAMSDNTVVANGGIVLDQANNMPLHLLPPCDARLIAELQRMTAREVTAEEVPAETVAEAGEAPAEAATQSTAAGTCAPSGRK